MQSAIFAVGALVSRRVLLAGAATTLLPPPEARAAAAIVARPTSFSLVPEKSAPYSQHYVENAQQLASHLQYYVGSIEADVGASLKDEIIKFSSVYRRDGYTPYGPMPGLPSLQTAYGALTAHWARYGTAKCEPLPDSLSATILRNVGDAQKALQRAEAARAALEAAAPVSLIQPAGAAEPAATAGQEVAGQWKIVETRAGQRCTGSLILEPELASSSPSMIPLGTRRGAASYSGPCVDAARGTWAFQEGAAAGQSARVASRLEYEKSSVFYSFALDDNGRGSAAIRLSGSGEIYASPRADPTSLRKVGSFTAQRTGP